MGLFDMWKGDYGDNSSFFWMRRQKKDTQTDTNLNSEKGELFKQWVYQCKILMQFFKLVYARYISLLSLVNSVIVLNGKSYRQTLLTFFLLSIYIFFQSLFSSFMINIMICIIIQLTFMFRQMISLQRLMMLYLLLVHAWGNQLNYKKVGELQLILKKQREECPKLIFNGQNELFQYQQLLNCNKIDINNILAKMQPENLKSFLEVHQQNQFPLENIPFGVYSRKGNHHHKRPATRIGDWVVDLHQLEKGNQFNGELFGKLERKIFHSEYLNDFMALSRPYWKQVRSTIQKLFSSESPLKDDQQKLDKYLIKIQDVQLHLPAKIGDYTDFYSSRSHAFNVGSIIRGPDNALNENWLHIPIGYHGRSSSIVVSGADVRRPRGQVKAKDAKQPSFSQCKRLDFEMQMGAFIGGTTNELGKPIKVNNAWQNIFGFVLLNDWSFRDFQTWQYVPLGPFTAKNGITTISPWILTVDALEGSEVPLSKQQPEPLPYLRQKNHISYDINLIVSLKTEKLEKPQPIVKTNYKYLYWSCAQQLAHHSVTGCNMKPGDLLGSGTISGEKKQQFGSLLEITWGGRDNINLSNGQTRKFIQDGDSIVITGFAVKNGKKIGFGECAGKVLPALPQSDYV